MDSIDAKELYNKAKEMPPGKAKLLLLEEAARISDFQNNGSLGFDIRADIIRLAFFHGFPLNGIVAFSSNLSYNDKNPNYLNNWYNLFHYKWILGGIDSFPEISSGKIKELYRDMKQRFRENGFNLNPYYGLKCLYHTRKGNIKKATKFYKKWIDIPLDKMGDCKACYYSHQITYHIFVKDYNKAIEVFNYIFENNLKCTNVPGPIYSEFLIPYLEIGKLKEAKEFHEKGYAAVSNNFEYIDHIALHMLFSAITNLDEAVEIFQKHIGWALETTDKLSQFYFHLSSWVLFERLKKFGHISLKIKLKGERNIFEKHNLDDISDVVAWFKDKTLDLADKFDKRNGTSYYNNLINKTITYIDFQL
jgi:tetratricopeptide (TPR) repeat protein